MKFMDKNNNFIKVGDNFEILIRNRPIPGSDFIEIMKYLQKGWEATEYKARNAHKRLYTVLTKYSKIQVLPGITSCRLMKYNKKAIELNSLLINNMPKDGYE